VAVLQNCKPAPDSLAQGVDLFPLPGVTPGLTGLIVSETNSTTLIVGDAIATVEHLERGSVLKNCYDYEKAQESFREAIEIADVLILGRDNLTINPTRYTSMM
jgi:glyoxylase-like metal-dependent hydrolase (beta-lactamase superfamily II)